MLTQHAPIVNSKELSVSTEDDIKSVRQLARNSAQTMGFKTVDQTKLTTAVSELARNMVVHGGGGVVVLDELDSSLHEANSTMIGIRISFTDQGPGIADLNLAMQNGYSTSNSLGLGLPGSKRLVNEFIYNVRIK